LEPERSRDNEAVTPREFVAAVEHVVYRYAVDATLAAMQEPSGRAPGLRAVELQRWYAALTAQDKKMVAAVARDAAHAGVFQFFCLLDGVVAFDDPPHAGLRLVAIEGDGTEHVLNESAGDLHDEFNALVHPPSEAWPPESGT
jgi:hypothetical protein